MAKSTIITIAVVVVLAIGGAVFFMNKSNSNKNPTPTTSTPASSTNTNSSSSNTSSNQSTSSGKVEITGNMIFTPSQISVAKGATVTWTNNDNIAHTVTDDLKDVGGPASGTIEPGGTYSFTFAKTGSFQYHCEFHSQMRGTIVVK
jgi:plastocyanin